MGVSRRSCNLARSCDACLTTPRVFTSSPPATLCVLPPWPLSCSDWFIKFKPTGPYINPQCDNNYNPPLCSNNFHMQEQTPGYPHGDGDCAAPACDCGNSPCGFYLWNVSRHWLVCSSVVLSHDLLPATRL